MANFFLDRRLQMQQKAKHRVSQHKIALAIGVTPNLVGYWERGQHAPQLKMAAKLAAVYGVPQERIERAIVEMNREIAAGRLEAAAAK